MQRKRAGVADELLLRTLATLPFVEQASLSGGSSVLLREPAVLLQLGWAPVGFLREAMDGIDILKDGKRSPCPVIPIPCVMRCGGWGVSLAARVTGWGAVALPAAVGAW